MEHNKWGGGESCLEHCGLKGEGGKMGHGNHGGDGGPNFGLLHIIP